MRRSLLYCGSQLEPVHGDVDETYRVVLQEHDHIDGVVRQPPVYLYIVVRENIGFPDAVFLNGHYVIQCGVLFIVLSALYLDGERLPHMLDHEVKLTLLLAVVVVQRIAVGMKLLRHHVFIYSDLLMSFSLLTIFSLQALP